MPRLLLRSALLMASVFIVQCDASANHGGHHHSDEDPHYDSEALMPILKRTILTKEVLHFEHDDVGGDLSYYDVTTLAETLLERVNCAGRLGPNAMVACDECAEVFTNRVFDSAGVDHTTSLNKETFTSTVCPVLLSSLENLEESCQVNSTSLVDDYVSSLIERGLDAERFKENEMADYLEELDKNYLPDIYYECFDAEVLFDNLVDDHEMGATADELRNVFAWLVVNLMEGQCIGHALYPNPVEFTHEILDTYGDGEAISLHGFVHMLEDLDLNSAGDHDHPVGDHDHDHPTDMGDENHVIEKRHADHDHHETELDLSIKKCLSAEELFAYHGFDEDEGLTEFQKLCPALIQQQLGGYCQGEHIHEKEDVTFKSYLYGSIFVLLITLSALIGAIIFPCVKGTKKELLLTFFIGLAISTLLSEAMLHLVPAIFGMHSHDGHGHTHSECEASEHITWKSSMVLLALYVFYLMEISAEYLKHGGRGDKYSYVDQKEVDAIRMEASEKKLSEEEHDIPQTTFKILKYGTLPVMIVMSGCLHNFADGLAIGASFSVSLGRGFSTGIAIVFHEISHEIGDLAILLKCGMPLKWALLFNALSGATSFVGLFIGVSASSTEGAQQWILGITAGMFFYIALVDMMPTVIDFNSATHPKLTLLLHNISFFVGVGIIVLVGSLEHNINVTL